MSMKETELNIKILGSPILRKKSKAVSKITDKEKKIFEDMLNAMYKNGGIGLAAPQVGLDIAMIVADIGQGPIMIANPKIISRQGKQLYEEGCLSVPGICVPIQRSKIVKIEALDKEGKTMVLEVQDLMATCLQHEIDHLDGKLIVDYLSFRKKLALRKKIKELKKRSKDESVPESEKKSCKMQL